MGKHDPWIYFKVHANPRVSQIILMETIVPLAKQLRDEGRCQIWFFVRYADPEPHIRIRFQVPFEHNKQIIKKRIMAILRPYQVINHIWSIQKVKYEPEYGRYGARNMETVHKIFYQQSLLAVSVHRAQSSQKQNIISHCHIIDLFLRQLGFSLWQKKTFVNAQRDCFAVEFELGRPQKKKISSEYRTISGYFLNPVNCPNLRKLKGQKGFLANMGKIRILMSTLEYDEAKLERQKIFGDLFHMQINKLFIYDQRAIEFVIYEFLDRWYSSELARRKSKIPTKH